MIPMQGLNRCLIFGHPLEMPSRPIPNAPPRTEEEPPDAPPEISPAVAEVWEYLSGQSQWQDLPEEPPTA